MIVRFFKVDALPGTLEANSFYFVENGVNAEAILTTPEGVARRLTNTDAINAIIGTIFGGYLDIVQETGTSRTLTANDHKKTIRCTNAETVTITVPSNLSVGFT